MNNIMNYQDYGRVTRFRK